MEKDNKKNNRKKYMFNEDDKNYILGIFALFILLSMAMYCIGLIFQTPKIKTVGDANGWLGFVGGLLGGIMTLLGVKREINENNKARKEDLSIEYKPILNLIDYDKKIERDNNLFNMQMPVKNKYENNKKKVIQYVYFKIKNIGRGEANDLNIKVNCNEGNSSYNKVFFIEDDKESQEMHYGFLPKETVIDCLFEFTDVSKYKNNGEPIVILLIINFLDLNRTKKYNYECEFYFTYKDKAKNKITCDGYKVLNDNVQNLD